MACECGAEVVLNLTQCLTCLQKDRKYHSFKDIYYLSPIHGINFVIQKDEDVEVLCGVVLPNIIRSPTDWEKQVAESIGILIPANLTSLSAEKIEQLKQDQSRILNMVDPLIDSLNSTESELKQLRKLDLLEIFMLTFVKQSIGRKIPVDWFQYRFCDFARSRGTTISPSEVSNLIETGHWKYLLTPVQYNNELVYIDNMLLF